MTYYQILGVKKSATQADIKNAYKKLAKKYHPDVYKGDKSFAEQKMKELNMAYDVLSDPSSRIAYDEEINPEPRYQYTPPKYDSAEDYYNKNSYTKYYSNSSYSYNSRSNNYSSSSVYNSFNKMHNNFSSSVIKSISKLKLIQKIIIFLLILLIYIVFILLSLSNFNNMANTVDTEPDEPVETYYPRRDSLDRDEFSIYDYISKEELESLYNKSRYNEYYTFDEYVEMIEEYYYRYYFAY